MTTQTQTSRYGIEDFTRDEVKFKKEVEPRMKELFSINFPSDFNNYDREKAEQKEKRLRELLQELEEHAFEAKSMTGRTVRFQMADSYAVYLVSRVNKGTCRLQCVYIGDEWEDDRLGKQGSLPIGYVHDDICRQDAMNKLFSK